MKKAFFLLIAAGILFSQFNLTTDYGMDGQSIVLLPSEESDNSLPFDPMEEYPEESESEDSKEGKDNDSKKWQQQRLFIKGTSILTKTAWAIYDTKQVIEPHISKIQQPPEGFFFA